MVLESAFWQAQAERFEKFREDALAESKRPFEASYHPDGWGLDEAPAFRRNASGRWLLEHGTESTVHDFKSIASVCAVATGCPNRDNAWVDWLDGLRRDSVDFQPGFITSSYPNDARPDPDAEMISTQLGEIADVFGASARLCQKIADECLKLELNRANSNVYVAPAAGRKGVIEPLLINRGWSTLDWAQVANVDFHTADDYLNDRTTPRRDTLKKLADALEIDPSSMPM